MTFLHYVEHVVDFPSKKIAHYNVPWATDESVAWRDVSEVNTANKGGRVGNSTAFLLPERELYEFMAPVMQSLAR